MRDLLCFFRLHLWEYKSKTERVCAHCEQGSRLKGQIATVCGPADIWEGAIK